MAGEISLPCLPSQSVVADQLHELSTPELVVELYRRLCVGRPEEPGPFKGTMLQLYLERLSEEQTSEEDN